MVDDQRMVATNDVSQHTGANVSLDGHVDADAEFIKELEKTKGLTEDQKKEILSARQQKNVKVPFKQSLAVALAAGMGYGFDAYAVNIYGIVLPEIQNTLQISAATAGMIGTIFLIGYTIGTVGFGMAADRFGRRDTLGVSILVYGTTTALGGLTHNFGLFTFLRFLTGVGGAGELAVGAPYTAEMWPRKYRALGTGGIMFSLYSLGYILAAIAALVIVPRWGWEPAFVFAIIPALFVFVLRRYVQESVRYTVQKLKAAAEAKSETGKKSKVRIWHVHHYKRRIVFGWLAYTANAVGYWGMTVFLTTYMVEKFGVSLGQAILYALFMYIGQFFLCYVGTGLADWKGRRPSAILAAVLMMVSIYFGVNSDSLSVYLLFGGMSIALLGWLWAVGDTWISELFPTEVRGTGFGISVGGGRVVSIFAPFLVGWGIDTYGVTTPYLAFIGLWVLTIIAYALGPETAGKELEETAILKKNVA